MDSLDHMKREHSNFKKMTSSIESAQDDKKKSLFKEFHAELSGHQEAEEYVVFPAVREKAKGKDVDIVLEMIEEHGLGNYQFSTLERTSAENETTLTEMQEEFETILKKYKNKKTLGVTAPLQ